MTTARGDYSLAHPVAGTRPHCSCLYLICAETTKRNEGRVRGECECEFFSLCSVFPTYTSTGIHTSTENTGMDSSGNSFQTIVWQYNDPQQPPRPRTRTRIAVYLWQDDLGSKVPALTMPGQQGTDRPLPSYAAPLQPLHSSEFERRYGASGPVRPVPTSTIQC